MMPTFDEMVVAPHSIGFLGTLWEANLRHQDPHRENRPRTETIHLRSRTRQSRFSRQTDQDREFPP